MNRFFKATVMFILLLFSFLVYKMYVPCLFKYFFHISCPMCGITRSIIALVNGNVFESFRYNAMGLLFLIFFVQNILLLLYDAVFNKKYLEKFYTKLGNHYILIIIILIINMVINNYRGV